jgi:hypothetical protein
VSDTKQAKAVCSHGWRGSTIDERIIDPCPSCGMRSLFVGSGGYLTCGSLSCKEPGVGRKIDALAAENAEMRAKLAAAEKVVRAARVFSIAHDNSDQFSLEPEDLLHEALDAYDAATRKEPQP